MPQQCSLESAAENMDWLVVTPSTPTVIVKSPVGRPDSPLTRCWFLDSRPSTTRAGGLAAMARNLRAREVQVGSAKMDGSHDL